MWQDFGTAIALVLIIEGIIPFLAPNRWQQLVVNLSRIDVRTMRIAGFLSMALGLMLLYGVRN